MTWMVVADGEGEAARIAQEDLALLPAASMPADLTPESP